MPAPEWLKGFSLIKITINMPNLKEIKFLSDNNIGSGVKVEKSPDAQVANIKVNPKLLNENPEQLQQIKELMRASVPNEGGILEAKTDELITNVSNFQSDPQTVSLIEELKTKLPRKDVPIWEAALYIRQVHQNGGRVEGLKNNIKFRYGDKGGNIANLCSAGYLEKIILPIYDELSKQPDFKPEEFYSQYDVIVTQYPFAVFVALQSAMDDIKQEIMEKIDYNKLYGTSTINIHAIGKENIRKVIDILDEKEITEKLNGDPKIKVEGNVLLAIIYF
jgi:DNA-binding protein YbaB